jgi:hypothetical protein
MKKYAILSLMAVLALGACDDDDPASPSGTAQVRIVNATTGTNFASINAFRGDAQIVSGIAASSATVCATTYTVPAGSQTINFRTTAGGATNQEQITFNFQANHKYTVIVYGTNADIRAMVVEDEATQTNATAGNRRFRFINASTSNTAGDVFARTTSTGNPTAGSVTASNIAAGFAAASGGNIYFSVPTANNIFQFYNTGTVTNPRTTYTLNATGFPASGNSTILFTDTGAFQINNCS